MWTLRVWENSEWTMKSGCVTLRWTYYDNNQMEMINLIAKIVISIDILQQMSSILHLLYSNVRGICVMILDVIKSVFFCLLSTGDAKKLI